MLYPYIVTQFIVTTFVIPLCCSAIYCFVCR